MTQRAGSCSGEEMETILVQRNVYCVLDNPRPYLPCIILYIPLRIVGIEDHYLFCASALNCLTMLTCNADRKQPGFCGE